MSKTPTVINPMTQKPLSKDAAKLVLQSREARAGARKVARSGHPGRRAEALLALRNIPNFINQIYVQEAH